MKTDNASQSTLARRHGLVLIIWSALMGGSLLWAMHQETRNTLSSANAAARANISKDLDFRRWATSHGGVYVSPTEHTPPNQYLKVPDRDVVTTTGKTLTLMNPAYMLRELQTDFPGEYGDKSHITSLKLLNPKNAPDDWEAGALQAFEQGEKERVELQQIDGKPYLRMMRPLIAEAGCLKCHGFQGYKVGDIRGGLSTAIALTPYLARERELKNTLALTHGAIWLIGLAGLGFSYRTGYNQAIERKQDEDKINELNRDLERRVGERTMQLETAVYDLENFNYSVSHDLRIPLRAVDGFSKILLDEYSQHLDDEGRRLLSVVRDSTSKMTQLIEDMQAFSRTGSMVSVRTKVNMDELVREVVEEFRPVIAGRELKLEIHSLPPVLADREMMRTVVVTLLSNAIKFTRPKAAALIEVGAKTEDNETIYYFKDNGVGFDMQYADKLFGVFQRLHGVTEFEGTGIGLAIVKRIITRHGGKVWAEGKVNEGATIYFAIPMKKAALE